MLLLLSTFLIVTGGSLLAGAQTCPDLFVEIEGSCYSFRSDYLATWDVSGYICSNLSTPSTLAMVKSADTHRGFYEYIMTYGLIGSFWLGGTDLQYEDDWHWIDDTRIQRGTPFWAIDSGVLGWSQSPDGKTDENCLALTEEKLYYFDDSPCETYNHPVCQMI
ncbi:hypothetical protein Pmani_033778 [Petrolisthes manimaculis]|uniref:C-type lectin domain-containing protein n=1 Tax=Petrolisthes manimaculis TaxID=1843537 RepID=A0AAE1NP24_9EUCA|nr:hypothetical protein Pmani_033778 [Petrolisthes manimaculis]